MNMQTQVRPELWLAISSSYQAGRYSHAILDAMHYLSTMLREKANVDGDGVSLVGQVLGGDAPRLRINKLQTQTERDVQKGLEQMLRGLYMAIRNPRSHESVEDTQDTAEAIICFINYILSVLDQSEEPFTRDKFISRVLDQDFVESNRYAELLAAEVPPNKRTDMLIDVYRNRLSGDGKKLKYMVRAMLKLLSGEQVKDFLDVVSEELRTTQDEASIRVTLQILPPDLWPRVDEVARLRMENKLIRSIQEGTQPFAEKPKGALGTWANRFLRHFTRKDDVGRALLQKLEEGPDSRRYVAEYFMAVLPDVIAGATQVQRLVKAVSNAVRNHDESVRTALLNALPHMPEEWQSALRDNLRDLTNPEQPAGFLFDGTPFLSEAEPEEELPF